MVQHSGKESTATAQSAINITIQSLTATGKVPRVWEHNATPDLERVEGSAIPSAFWESKTALPVGDRDEEHLAILESHSKRVQI